MSKDVKLLKNGNPEEPNLIRKIASVVGDEKNMAIVEWKYADGPFSQPEKKIIRSRTKSLAYVLRLKKSFQFGLLKCTGFYKDEEYQDKTVVEKFGLLFKLPTRASQNLLQHHTTTTILAPKSKAPPMPIDSFRIATAPCHGSTDPRSRLAPQSDPINQPCLFSQLQIQPIQPRLSFQIQSTFSFQVLVFFCSDCTEALFSDCLKKPHEQRLWTLIHVPACDRWCQPADPTALINITLSMALGWYSLKLARGVPSAALAAFGIRASHGSGEICC